MTTTTVAASAVPPGTPDFNVDDVNVSGGLRNFVRKTPKRRSANGKKNNIDIGGQGGRDDEYQRRLCLSKVANFCPPPVALTVFVGTH